MQTHLPRAIAAVTEVLTDLDLEIVLRTTPHPNMKTAQTRLRDALHNIQLARKLLQEIGGNE